MKNKKQSRVDALEKRMAATTNVIQALIDELNNVKTMAIGTYSLVKEMPGHDEAIEKLKNNQEETSKNKLELNDE
jgi:hypothetical protein